jgi:hypothetical protein
MPVNAQSDFRQGYIITLNSDTLFGKIDFRGSIYNAQHCNFMANESSQPREFKPGQIISYRFTDGKYFVSKMIKDSLGQHSVFLEYLVHGMADLYYYKSDLSDRFFIQKSSDTLVELSNDEKLVKINGSEYFKKTNQYIGALKIYFYDCGKLQDEINQIPFNTRGLLRIAQDYHNLVCDTGKCIVYKKKMVLKFRFAPIVRYNYSSAYFSHTTLMYYHKLIYSNVYDNLEHTLQPNYGAGLQAELIFPMMNEKLSVQFETLISKNSYEDYSTETIISGEINNTVDVKTVSSENFLLIKYTFPTGKIRPLIFGGGSFVMPFSISSRRVSIMNQLNNQTTIHYSDVPYSKHFIGFAGGFGINYMGIPKHPVFLQAQFEKFYGELVGHNPICLMTGYSLHAGIYF